ncbi:MAG: M67 family metallopeptidase [Armatimonadota bacterium]
MIQLPAAIFDDIIQHARELAPVECCGLLAGNSIEVSRHYRLTNIDDSPEHFSLDPKEQFAAVKDARPLGLDIIAVYHSHPASPARMSEEDLRLAFAPGFRFVIVSLLDADHPILKCFIVVDGQSVEEPVIVKE